MPVHWENLSLDDYILLYPITNCENSVVKFRGKRKRVKKRGKWERFQADSDSENDDYGENVDQEDQDKNENVRLDQSSCDDECDQIMLDDVNGDYDGEGPQLMQGDQDLNQNEAENTSYYRKPVPRRCREADEESDSEEPIAIPMYDFGLDEDLADKQAGKEDRRRIKLSGARKSSSSSDIALDDFMPGPLAIWDVIEKAKRSFRKSLSEGNVGSRGYDEEKVRIELSHFWNMRYSLFSLFDHEEGVKLDYESWYSVTPEDIAKGIAVHCNQRNRKAVIVDAFCGCGGNAIQFAKTSATEVIAIDIDPKKLEFAKHNAKLYGVSHKITFMKGNFMEVASTLKADVVFLNPPWGWPSYIRKEEFDLKEDLSIDGYELFETAQRVSKNIAFYLPKTTKMNQLMDLGRGLDVEVQDLRMEVHVVGRVAYYGNLVGKPTKFEPSASTDCSEEESHKNDDCNSSVA